ncbi:MAG: IS256 family transposase [Geodermatophilaceae bacterium]|nr:IS256 family transposase [Geodermatophilaceae bacterium]
MLKVVQEESESNAHVPAAVGGSLLDELVRDGARAMLAAALQAEVAAYVEAHADQVDEAGHRLVVRNGHHAAREVTTAAGAVPVRAPRVNDQRTDGVTGERKRFSSRILPAWARKSPQVAEVLPLLCLHGLSSGDFGPALTQFLGSGAGLSAATITRLTGQWQDEVTAFNKRSLKDTDFVYMWVDGIHLKVRLEQDKVCLLVMIGVRADGTKELIALADGFRESSESWADLLRGCKRRGMRAPVLAIGDGALGFWKAVREVFPETKEQRCWFHVGGNVLSALPKSAHPGAKAALAEIYNAEDKEHALKAAKAFEDLYGAKWPKATAKITEHLDVLLAFYDYPAEHWIHLRTTNPIESTFATVRLRQRVTKGPGSRAAGVAMAFKLIESAQHRWRAVNAPHLVALVRAGATFEKGRLIERPDESGEGQQVA